MLPLFLSAAAAYAVSLPSPDALIGLTPQDVRAQLGEPDLLRSDDPAQVWRYDDGFCALHVFLYRPENGGAPTVAYAEIRPTTPALRTGQMDDSLAASGQSLDPC